MRSSVEARSSIGDTVKKSMVMISAAGESIVRPASNPRRNIAVGNQADDLVRLVAYQHHLAAIRIDCAHRVADRALQRDHEPGEFFSGTHTRTVPKRENTSLLHQSRELEGPKPEHQPGEIDD